MRVLLVDDEESIRTIYGAALEDVGLEVATASDAEEALMRTREEKWNVILSDIQMPRMTGIQLLKKVREVDLDVPIVLMTGGPTIDSAIEAIEYGAFRYLRKPIPATDLQDAAETRRYRIDGRPRELAVGSCRAGNVL
jgi:DNA-binding NtrC family response regulator